MEAEKEKEEKKRVEEKRQHAKAKEERHRKKTEEKQKIEIVTLNVGGRKFSTLNTTVKGILDKVVLSNDELFIDRDA
jgi:hypothetical protein